MLFHPLVTFLKFHAALSLWLLRLACLLPLLPRILSATRLARGKGGGASNTPGPASWPDHFSVVKHLAAFVLAIVLIAALGDPTAERRTSFGQPCIRNSGGKAGTGCPQLESCFWGGFARRAYVCTKDNVLSHDLYQICDGRCDAARNPLETYTTCGVAVEGYEWHALALMHAVAVMALAWLPLMAAAEDGKKKA